MKLKKHFKEVLKIKRSPESIAMGFAIGTFLAILPTFGFGILIGLVVILIFERVSKISMFVAFAVWNPFVLVSMYGLSYLIGDWILGDAQIVEVELTVLQQFYKFTRRFLIGNILLSTFISITSYIMIYFGMSKYQKKLRNQQDI